MRTQQEIIDRIKQLEDRSEFGEVFEEVDRARLDGKLNAVFYKNELEIMKVTKERYRLLRETTEDIIELVIEKARNFPDYPVSELKKELRSWIDMVNGL